MLTASVRDAAGHTGSDSATVTLANGAHAGAVTAAFSSPAAGARVSGTVSVGATASGGSGSGYSYRMSVDGATVAIGSSYSWDTRSVVNGNHTLTLTVTDSAGKTATASRTVTVASTRCVAAPPPTEGVKVYITQPRGGASVSGTAWVVLWAEGTSGSSNTFTLSVNGATVGTETSGARGPITIPWRTSGSGTRTLTGTVRDATGKSGSTSMTVTVRN